MNQDIIIIPTLNERKNLEALLPEIFNFIPGIHVLIVDDASKDGTRDLISELQHKYPSLFLMERRDNPGYGKSSLDGFKWAIEKGYGHVATMDADFSHDYKEVPRMIEKLNSADIVTGSRYVKGGSVENWSTGRKMLSRFANAYVRSILGLTIHDSTSGFNAYQSRALASLDFNSIHSEGYAFLVELKYKLLKKGFKFAEHPIVFYERREGHSKMSSKVIWESVWMPWKLRLGK